MASAGSTVLGATVAAGGLTAVRHLADGTFKFTVVFNVFMLGATLILISLVSDSIAKGLALLVLLGSVLENGPTVFSKLGALH